MNIAKVAELTKAGRMHPAGTRAFEERDRRKDAGYSHERFGSGRSSRYASAADRWRPSAIGSRAEEHA